MSEERDEIVTIPRPIIDYAALPHQPREGVQASGNWKYATKSLFLETATAELKPKALWCLAEHEVFAYGRWYPSAWMAYIHADDEYDALRKICGNVKQWEHIKAMTQPKDFSKLFAYWQLEQGYVQRNRLRQVLYRNALAGEPGYVSAAKTILQMMGDAPKLGRPKKAVEPKEEQETKEANEDAKRVLQFQQ